MPKRTGSKMGRIVKRGAGGRLMGTVGSGKTRGDINSARSSFYSKGPGAAKKAIKTGKKGSSYEARVAAAGARGFLRQQGKDIKKQAGMKLAGRRKRGQPAR